MKNSFMNSILKNIIEENKDLTDDIDANDDRGFLDKNYCSQQHFDEFLGRSNCNDGEYSTENNEQRLAPPQSLIEYLIYWTSRLKSYTSTSYRPSGYWRYAIGVYKNLFLVFYFNWVAIFTSPLSSLAFIITYPIISGALFAFEIGLKIFLEYLGGSELVDHISQDYGSNFSIINWGAPQLLLSQKSSRLIQSTLPSLGKTAPEATKNNDNDHRHRTFDISIAQTMTILSSLVYERQNTQVTKAYKSLIDFKKKQRKGGSSIAEKETIEMEIKRLIWQSEKPIRKIARAYGLHFAGVTELKSLGGPFCGLYWPISKDIDPFIIVALKGTTPTNYSEFLVDATLQRTDARAYLFGSAHQGFYDSIFPTYRGSGTDSRDPYYAIQTAIRDKAAQIQKTHSQPVQVWVTGHSLGAAMGALLFARWIKCPEDITPLCELRDAYVIGTPAVGDNDFASMFASYSNIPSDRSSTLWRIINKSDLICRIPPGYNNITIGHYMPSTDFFNYSHVGHAVQITHPILSSQPLKIYPSSYQSNLRVDITVSTSKKYSQDRKFDNNTSLPAIDSTIITHYPKWIRPFLQRVKNPIPVIESFYPYFLKDHIPIHYFEGLERASAYYTTTMCDNDAKGK